MVLYLLDGWSLGSVIAEKSEDQVLEIFTKSGSVNLLEVGIVASLEEEVVEVLFLAGLFEGEDSLNDDENDYSNGEHVNFSSFVFLILLDFWCHVSHGSSVALKVIDSLVASETEVGNLKVEVVSNKDVLELEVSVNNSFAVHVSH